MSTSAVQVLANRANAQHSTGPRSDEGKRTSSQNSVTTGLTSAAIFIRPDEQEAFAEFKAELAEEHQPVGATQRHHFSLILHAAWNIRRCFLLEAEIQSQASSGLTDALLDDDLARKLDRIYRYRKMHESSHRRASAELRHLQTEQLWRQQNQESQTHEEAQQQSILVDTTKVKIKLSQRNATEEQANLNVLRQHIEAFIAPPVPRRN